MPFFVHFDPDCAVLLSAVRGALSAVELEEWRLALLESTIGLPGAAEFRFLSDFYDYQVDAQDLAVHKRMREIGPRFLAAHGFVTGFWRLYAATPPPRSRTGTCVRVAHVHRDCYKMERYNELLASAVERFFCDRDAARAWLHAT